MSFQTLPCHIASRQFTSVRFTSFHCRTAKNTKQAPQGLEEGHLATQFPCRLDLPPHRLLSRRFRSMCTVPFFHFTLFHDSFPSAHDIPIPSLSHHIKSVHLNSVNQTTTHARHFSLLRFLPVQLRKEHQTVTKKAGGRSSRYPNSATPWPSSAPPPSPPPPPDVNRSCFHCILHLVASLQLVSFHSLCVCVRACVCVLLCHCVSMSLCRCVSVSVPVSVSVSVSAFLLTTRIQRIHWHATPS